VKIAVRFSNACGDCAPYGNHFGSCKARPRSRKPHPQGANGVSRERVGWGSSQRLVVRNVRMREGHTDTGQSMLERNVPEDNERDAEDAVETEPCLDAHRLKERRVQKQRWNRPQAECSERRPTGNRGPEDERIEVGWIDDRTGQQSMGTTEADDPNVANPLVDSSEQSTLYACEHRPEYRHRDAPSEGGPSGEVAHADGNDDETDEDASEEVDVRNHGA